MIGRLSKWNFYSLINENGVIGVKEQRGYKIQTHDVTVYAYEDMRKSKIYFIDPATGLSLYCQENVGVENIGDGTMENIITVCREKLASAKKTKEYRFRVKTFKGYKKARLFYEGHRSIF